MKISEFMEQLYNRTAAIPTGGRRSCDTLKAGDPEQELAKVAVSMFATCEVVRDAVRWGANLLIIHEPLFYNHMDDPAELAQMPAFKQKIIAEKRKMIEEAGLVIYRFHDRPHLCREDMISIGEIHYSGLASLGKWSKGAYFGVNRFELHSPLSARELAALLRKNLSLGCIRIAGDPETSCKKIGLCFGTPGHVEETLEECDAVLTGEIREWDAGEFVRDCAQLGHPRALLVLGHIGSERDGMRLLAEELPRTFPGVDARYFECGELYSIC